MSRSSILIVLGVVVLLVPFIGVPESWIAGIEAICGVVLIGLGVHARAALTQQSEPAPAPQTEESPHPSAMS